MLGNVENVKITHSRLSDEELVERFRNGDRESLDVLVSAYITKAYGIVHSRVPESDAADVRQDIFLSVTESIGSFKNSSNFAAWFRSIAKRRIADYYRRRSRRRENLTENQIPEVDDDPWEKIDDELTVENALREVPENYAQVMLLMFFEGLSLVEIAERLGLTYEAARYRYRRGIGALREKVKEQGTQTVGDSLSIVHM